MVRHEVSILAHVTYHIFSLTLAFCRTLPLVAMMEAGLALSADAELTGDTGSALTLLLEGCNDDEDVDEGAGAEDVWGAGIVATLTWWKNSKEIVKGRIKQTLTLAEGWKHMTDWRQYTDHERVLEATVQCGSQCERPRFHFLQTLPHLHQS